VVEAAFLTGVAGWSLKGKRPYGRTGSLQFWRHRHFTGPDQDLATSPTTGLCHLERAQFEHWLTRQFRRWRWSTSCCAVHWRTSRDRLPSRLLRGRSGLPLAFQGDLIRCSGGAFGESPDLCFASSLLKNSTDGKGPRPLNRP
jgi:hypothetical protein